MVHNQRIEESNASIIIQAFKLYQWMIIKKLRSGEQSAYAEYKIVMPV